ncbi:MAG: VanZ family protein [Myxococcales bacterium]|nr:VanZ family protein [Myxococcales bacterium]
MPSRRASWSAWLPLVAVVLAVYFTLPWVRSWFEFASRAGLGRAIQGGLLLGALSGGGGILAWLWLRRRVRAVRVYLSLAIAAGLLAAIAVLLSPMPIERIHLAEYLVIGMLSWRALRGHWTDRDRLLTAALLVFNIGLGDELLQGLLAGRFYDTRDVLVNAAAGGLGAWSAAVIVRAITMQTNPKSAA